MGRGQKSKSIQVDSKTLDAVKAEKILSSNVPREVKMRQLCQLQNGNRKLGTLQAKEMLDNYNSRPKSFMQNFINNLDPQTREMIDQLKQTMTPEQLAGFNNMSKEAVENMINNIEKQTPKEEPVAGPSEPIEEELKEQEFTMKDGNLECVDDGKEDDGLEIKESDLPKLSEQEFNFLNKLKYG